MEKNIINSIELSHFGEDTACRFLKKNGCKVIDRNFRVPGGEIDVVAKSRDHVIFVEVKTRFAANYGEPWEAVGFRKRNRVKAAARAYIGQHRLRDTEFRFDIISITFNDSMQPQIEWLQNAF
jgi:putative endonuclease